MTKGSEGILLGVIPARGGSKGIINKNLKKILGKPLIAYTIKDALSFKKIFRVIVTTDSPKIASIARRFGAEVPFIRPKSLARDNSAMLDVLKHALLKCEKLYATKIDGIFLFDPTSPLREKSEMEAMIDLFWEKKPDLAVAVSKSRRNPYFNMLKINKKGCAQLAAKGNFVRRQDAPPVFDITNNGWIFSRRAILRGWRLPCRTIAHEIHGFTVDIDKKEDLKMFEFFLKIRGNI